MNEDTINCQTILAGGSSPAKTHNTKISYLSEIGCLINEFKPVILCYTLNVLLNLKL